MYEDEKGEHRYVHQTTYGMSERLLGAVVAIHGDDKGLVLPPDIATNQVVIVPVLAKGHSEKVTAAAKELYAEIRSSGVKIHLDDKDVRPGVKYYDWELKGVPLRLELGMKDIEKEKVTFVRRDTGVKSLHDRKHAVKEVKDMLSLISREMLGRAMKDMEANIVSVESLDTLPEKMLRAGWCGSEECGHEIEARSNRNILGTPIDGEEWKGACVICGKPTKTVVYLANAM